MRLVRSGTIALALVASLVAASVAHAGTVGGLRGGFSSDPDQVVFGGQLEPPPVADNLYIVPAGEVGIGDDLFSLAFHGDLQYRFETGGSVRPYVGGGLTVYHYDPDGDADGDTNLGANVLGGIFFGRGFPMFLDLKLGLTDDVPDLVFDFGVMFR